MIDLRSDTVTLPSPEMKTFMLEAPLGDDVYGEDPTINLLENKASILFDKEDALFVPSGTMANLIAVLSHCERGDEFLLGDKSHIFKSEAGGASVLGGLHSHQLPNNIDGTINIENITSAINDSGDEHCAITRLLCLENTHNICYGTAIEPQYFSDVKKTISPFKISLHIDGARIFNASIALQVDIDILAQEADSISCCLSKGLSCPAGSLVLGSNDFILRARRLRKILGGGMRQGGLLAAAGIYALDNMVQRLQEDHDNARELAVALSELVDIDVDTHKVSTNLIFFHLKHHKLSDNDFIDKLNKNNIKIMI